MKKSIFFSAIILSLIFLTSFKTDEIFFPPKSKKTIFQHFRKNKITEMTLELDFKQYRKKKKTNDYLPAKLSAVHPDGIFEDWEIEVRPRGRMRRRVCDLPSMKLRFSEAQLSERGLKKRRTLKMVNICRRQSSAEQMLLKEYLAYVMYNKITKNSLRVHLAKVKYIDSKNKETRDESYAFFIEHPKDLADRRDLELVEGKRANTLKINSGESEIFTLFQYMIGNTDWFYFNTHNVELYQEPDTRQPIPVPYDFDYSGLVLAPYAVPDERLKLTHVSERYYQGNCRKKEDTQKNIDLFLEKKEKVFAAISEVPGLDKRNKKYVQKYISRFYKIIEKPKIWKREITKHCDLWPVR